MADWEVTPQPLAGITTTGWWVDAPAVVVESVTGWWEVTAQLLVPLVGSASALLHPPTVTAGARPTPNALAAAAAMAAPSLVVSKTAPATSATAAMTAPVIRGSARVAATPMTAAAAATNPTYNLNFSSGGGFPYTFDFPLDSTFTPTTFDYTFDFALG